MSQCHMSHSHLANWARWHRHCPKSGQCSGRIEYLSIYNALHFRHNWTLTLIISEWAGITFRLWPEIAIRDSVQTDLPIDQDRATNPDTHGRRIRKSTWTASCAISYIIANVKIHRRNVKMQLIWGLNVTCHNVTCHIHTLNARQRAARLRLLNTNE